MNTPSSGSNPTTRGGRGHRTGELRAARRPDPASKAAQHRIQVLRDPLWEVQAGETSKAYEAFRIYRDQGSSRTIKRTTEIMGYTVNARHPNNAASNHLAEWSSKYRWGERARAYDAYLDTMLTGERERYAREAQRQWFAREEALRETEWELMQAFADKIRAMLQHPITRVTKRKESRDGRTIWMTIIEPARWDWKSAAEIMKHTMFQGRMAAGMVTDGARAAAPDPTERGASDVDAWLASLGVEVGPADSIEVGEEA